MQYYVETEEHETRSALQKRRCVTTFKQDVEIETLNDAVGDNRSQEKIPEECVSLPGQEPEPEGLHQMNKSDV